MVTQIVCDDIHNFRKLLDIFLIFLLREFRRNIRFLLQLSAMLIRVSVRIQQWHELLRVRLCREYIHHYNGKDNETVLFFYRNVYKYLTIRYVLCLLYISSYATYIF